MELFSIGDNNLRVISKYSVNIVISVITYSYFVSTKLWLKHDLEQIPLKYVTVLVLLESALLY